MFENEIEFIYKYNLNKIEHLGSFITYEQLLSTNIHPALLKYLSAEIDFLIYEDRRKLLKESLFDYSGDKIVEHFANIGEEIKRTKKFSYEYLSKLLLHASSFNTNCIIRPKWSLLQFIFENDSESTKQIIEVKQILNYLYYYPYLKRLLVNFFDKKRITTISNSELKELLDKIDNINYESNFDKVTDSALTSMNEFIYMGEVNSKKVSKYFVELFLADKGLSHFQNVLTERFGSSNVEKFEITELKNTILSYNSEEDLAIDKLFEDGEKTEDILDEPEEANEGLLDESNVIQKKSTLSLINTVDSDIVEDNIKDSLHADADNSVEGNMAEEKKSFLESHLENLDSEDEMFYGSNKEDLVKEEEHESAELDEDSRLDEENIDEIYELATEEEKLDTIIDDEETPLPRIEIDNNENPFDEVNENSLVDNENKNEIEEQLTDDADNGYIEQGTSITFKAGELIPKEELIMENDADIIKESEPDVEEWPSESSSNIDESDVISPILDVNNSDTNEVEETSDKSNSDVMNEIEAILAEEEDAETNTDSEDKQQKLFNDEYLDEISQSEEEISEYKDDGIVTENNAIEEEDIEQSIDISLLLENKKITKIIEVVFDYDMEEFANAIDKISECRSETEAHNAIDEFAKKSFVDSSVKEIKVFKNIISDFFQ